MSPSISIRLYKLVDWELWDVKLRVLSFGWVELKTCMHKQGVGIIHVDDIRL
jgi:hypothetical protein